MHLAMERGGAAAEARVAQCAALMLTHLEAGWDAEYGGLLLAIDAHGGVACIEASAEPPERVSLLPNEYVDAAPMPAAIRQTVRALIEGPVT